MFKKRTRDDNPAKQNQKKAKKAKFVNDEPAIESEDNEKEYTSIKSTLNSILRTEYADQVKTIIFERAKTMTKISSLATLLLLHKANQAVDTNDKHFFLGDGKNVIFNCFDAVLAANIYDTRKMPREFRLEMEHLHPDHEWPSKTGLDNSYEYYRQQYITNLKTNLNTHCEKRLTYFFRIQCFICNMTFGPNFFDGTDIRNILKDAMKNQDWCDGDAHREWKRTILWNHLERIGFPLNTCIKEYVQSNWFESLWAFIRMEREIEDFLIQAAEPNECRPPTVNNFTAIPLCNTHLKHIKIDTKVCYYLTSKFGALPKYTNENTGRENNVPLEYYTSKELSSEQKAERKAELFGILFDMEKIGRNGKHAKVFYGQIDSDGVSATTIYERAKRTIFFCLLMTFLKYTLEYFVNVIGIDPGDKTWLAGVRRDIRSRVEVST